MSDGAMTPEAAAVIVGRMAAFAPGDDAALSPTLTDIGSEALQRESARMDNSQPPGITPITPNMQPGGAVPPPAMRKRVSTFALYEPYEMFMITAWVNYPARMVRDGMKEAELRTSLGQIVLDHNLVDFDGVPYPPASDDAFWEQIPQDVAAVIIQSIQGQMGRLDPTKRAS